MKILIALKKVISYDKLKQSIFSLYGGYYCIRCISIEEGDTMLCLKKISPTRLIKNELYNKIAEAENAGASADELREISGTAAAKRGIFEGDVEGGYLEIGQIASAIKEIKPVSEIMKTLVAEYQGAKKTIG